MIDTGGKDDTKGSAWRFKKENRPWAYDRVLEISRKKNNTRDCYVIQY